MCFHVVTILSIPIFLHSLCLLGLAKVSVAFFFSFSLTMAACWISDKTVEQRDRYPFRSSFITLYDEVLYFPSLLCLSMCYFSASPLPPPQKNKTKHVAKVVRPAYVIVTRYCFTFARRRKDGQEEYGIPDTAESPSPPKWFLVCALAAPILHIEILQLRKDGQQGVQDGWHRCETVSSTACLRGPRYACMQWLIGQGNWQKEGVKSGEDMWQWETSGR